MIRRGREMTVLTLGLVESMSTSETVLPKKFDTYNLVPLGAIATP